jgi:hypothetical protein
VTSLTLLLWHAKRFPDFALAFSGAAAAGTMAPIRSHKAEKP